MKNIDQELINWAVTKIEREYPEDVALLIGQIGACKTPADEQNMAFDFFIPSTERAYGLARTFIIEDMGYDLYPISWERLQGIVDLKEPRMIFAFMKGEVLYAKSEMDRKHYMQMKQQLKEHLMNKELTFSKALEFLNTAMEIYQTMMFEESLCAVRKAAGGVSCYLMNAIAMVNGEYLKNGYGNLTLEMSHLSDIPTDFAPLYQKLLEAKTIAQLQDLSRSLIRVTRDFFILKKPAAPDDTDAYVNYEELADWYYEARYTFRRIAYYAAKQSVEDCFLLGCYLQIEFDAILPEFQLKPMDLLGAFDSTRLDEFAKRACELENYVVDLLKTHGAADKIYADLNEFLANNK